ASYLAVFLRDGLDIRIFGQPPSRWPIRAAIVSGAVAVVLAIALIWSISIFSPEVPHQQLPDLWTASQKQTLQPSANSAPLAPAPTSNGSPSAGSTVHVGQLSTNAKTLIGRDPEV